MTNVAVLEAATWGLEGLAEHAIVRSNYRTPEGIAFYDHSVKLYEKLAGELDYNIMFSQRGHLTWHTRRGCQRSS
ncbi:MAG: hypothetical protein CM1200mP2_49930 [Planctomycetaceae bacterium]|nr:MAG: hypothetical protein CM1200mP2_49930 [Planctomycetaceae bacterium]